MMKPIVLRGLAAAILLSVSAGANAQSATDVAQGKRLFLRCASCHAVTSGTAGRIGPNLQSVYGRKAGSLPGFSYSNSMKAQQFAWDNAKLDAWLARPSALVPGTTMAFAGMSNPKERAAVVAYLKSLKSK